MRVLKQGHVIDDRAGAGVCDRVALEQRAAERAGGGAGGTYRHANSPHQATGGSGGGGNGTWSQETSNGNNYNSTGINGTDGSGGGGGGAGEDANRGGRGDSAGDGGNGVVIIRYAS